MVPNGYMQGGAYVLSRMSIRRLAEEGIRGERICDRGMPEMFHFCTYRASL